MPFFGQVWVWSLAGFLVGALLCWILIANPARKRVADLQSRLAVSRRREATATVAAEYDDEYESGDDFGGGRFTARDRDDRDDFEFRDRQAATALVPGFGAADERDPFDRGDRDVFDRDAFERAAFDRDTFDSEPSALRADDHEYDRDAPRVQEDEFDQAEFAAEHARFDHDDDQVDVDEHDQTRYVALPGHDQPEEEPALAGSLEERLLGADSSLPQAEATQYIPAARVPEDDEPRRDWFAGDRPPADDPATHDATLLVDLNALPTADDDHDLSDDQLEVAQDDQEDDGFDQFGGHIDSHLVDDLDSADPDGRDSGGGTIFTQHTTPIPAELIRQIDAQGSTESVDGSLVDDIEEVHETGVDDSVDDRVDDRADAYDDDESGSRHGLIEDIPAPVDTATQFVRPVTPSEAPLPVRVAREHSSAFGQLPPGTTAIPLPKRVPAKPQQGLIPFGTATAAAPVPAEVTTSIDRERSLFEPVREADEAPSAAQASPPSRQLRTRTATKQAPGGVDPFVPPGPFGPGSAMPMPGGMSPSSEYTIKASVTALRYCSPESPKFDRTVAEVWFRSVADAERVGFRPLG
jgi:hypothetical protein